MHHVWRPCAMCPTVWCTKRCIPEQVNGCCVIDVVFFGSRTHRTTHLVLAAIWMRK